MKKRMTFGVIAAECSREYTSQVLGGIIDRALPVMLIFLSCRR